MPHYIFLITASALALSSCVSTQLNKVSEPDEANIKIAQSIVNLPVRRQLILEGFSIVQAKGSQFESKIDSNWLSRSESWNVVGGGHLTASKFYHYNDQRIDPISDDWNYLLLSVHSIPQESDFDYFEITNNLNKVIYTSGKKRSAK